MCCYGDNFQTRRLDLIRCAPTIHLSFLDSIYVVFCSTSICRISCCEIVFYASQTDVGSSVNIKLLVADPDKVSSTDTLPLGSDQEMQVIQEVLQLLGVVPTATDEVANANKQV